jgi:hypothetical protein
MMADAVKDLLGNDATAPAPAAPAGAAEVPATPPTTTPEAAPAPEPDSAYVSAAVSQATSDDPDASTRKKVIKPLTPDAAAPVQPDLNELLAKEGITDFDKDDQQAPAATYAQAAGTPQAPPASTQPHPPGHVISPNPTLPTDSQGKPIDPNSISL